MCVGRRSDSCLTVESEDTSRQKAIREYLTLALHADAPYPEISERRTPRQVRSLTIPTETNMELDETRQLSVLEVSAPDRPGLLARIGQIFVDFNVEIQAAKLLLTFNALVFVVVARRVPPHCAARAHEVSVRVPMVPYHLRVPTGRIKHVLACRAPVPVVGQALFPVIAFDTTLAS